VGPSVAELGTFGNYGLESVGAKIMYTVDMFLGRVEMYPILAVFTMIFGRREK
jgi:trk system potassium uptake protein TrkH